MIVACFDFSPDMLAKAKNKFKDSPIKFLEMNAEGKIIIFVKFAPKNKKSVVTKNAFKTYY